MLNGSFFFKDVPMLYIQFPEPDSEDVSEPL